MLQIIQDMSWDELNTFLWNLALSVWDIKTPQTDQLTWFYLIVLAARGAI